jgi:hypothetical protein
MNPAEMLRRDGNSSVVAWASGRNTSSRRHSSTSAAVGYDPRSRQPPLLSTLSPSIGLPVHLSRAFITTVSAAFVPSVAQLGCVRRSTDHHRPPV